MKVFSVFGISKSGKTTTIEKIIAELKRRRYTVGSVKDIHYEGFAMDKEGTNTFRHYSAGAEVVTARGLNETDIIHHRRLDIDEILKYYHHDFVVLEGVTDTNVPRIITAHNINEIDERLDGSVFAISGRIAAKMNEYKGIPVINALDNIQGLVDLIEDKVFEKLPDFDAECCSLCGYSCRELTQLILRGKAQRDDCRIKQAGIRLVCGGKEIEMVPFVKNILYNSVLGVVKELKGYVEGNEIKIEIGGR